MPGSSRWIAALGLTFAVVCLRCAWVSDDAYVTLRTLDHFVGGYGLRYNPAERVQAFTHPLWLAALAGPYAATRDGWLMPMAAGLALTTLAAAGLATRVATGPRGAAVALIGLIGSKAAVDYGTSGLENPLENLLLVAFVAELFGRARLGWLGGLTGLLAVTRLDAPALVVPALVVAAAERKPREWLSVGVGAAPVLLWHGFALVYYGALLPNTAYAKLGTGLPLAELARQSGWYFAWTARVDPLTLPAIGAGLAAAVFARDRRSLALALGIALHLAWVVRIGGDFMGGRFFVAPLWLALALLARVDWSPRALGTAVALAAASLLSPYAPLRSGPGYEKAPPSHGVVDERGYYWRGLGLWGGSSLARGPRHEFGRDGREARGTPVVVKSVVGLFGYEAGPGVHVVDRLGLTDPLLARLPAQYDPSWRIGHFRRHLPQGYLESVGADANTLADPALARLYDAVRLATRAPLGAPGRWAAIAALHTRSWGVDEVAARYPEVRWVEPGPEPVRVGRGVGVVTTGRTGRLVVEGAGLTVIADAGAARSGRWDGDGPFVVPLGGLDRVVVFGPEAAAVVVSVTPGG